MPTDCLSPPFRSAHRSLWVLLGSSWRVARQPVFVALGQCVCPVCLAVSVPDCLHLFIRSWSYLEGVMYWFQPSDSSLVQKMSISSLQVNFTLWVISAAEPDSLISWRAVNPWIGFSASMVQRSQPSVPFRLSVVMRGLL